MTENKENWLYPDASGLYFPHDGFIMRATDGKQYDYEEECELLNEYDKKYNEYRKDVLRLEEELDYYKTKCGSLEEGLFQQDRKIAKLEKENKELKQSISDWQGSYDELYEDNLKLEKENKILYDENIQLRNKLLHFIQLKDDVKYLEEKGVF